MKEIFQRLHFGGKTFGTKKRSPGNKLCVHQEVGSMLVPGPFLLRAREQPTQLPLSLSHPGLKNPGLYWSNCMHCWNSPVDRFSIVELLKQQHKLMVQKG